VRLELGLSGRTIAGRRKKTQLRRESRVTTFCYAVIGR